MTHAPAKPRRIRCDGWTLPRQRMFIQMLAVTGSVALAARHAGLSTSSAYRLRHHPEASAFATAWTDALAASAASRQMIVFGRKPPVNDRLLMFLLGNNDKRRVRSPTKSLLDNVGRQ